MPRLPECERRRQASAIGSETEATGDVRGLNFGRGRGSDNGDLAGKLITHPGVVG